VGVRTKGLLVRNCHLRLLWSHFR